MNGALMGSELPAGNVPQVKVACKGSNGIDHVRIVRNGRVVHTQPCHGEWEYEMEWEDREYDPSLPSSYYVRVVQKDRESAWSSPVWVG